MVFSTPYFLFLYLPAVLFLYYISPFRYRNFILLVFNLLILHFTGNVGVAAYGIIANLALVGLAIFTGVAQGIQPLTSHAYGTGNAAELRQLLRLAVGLVLWRFAAFLEVLLLGGAWSVLRFARRSAAARLT